MTVASFNLTPELVIAKSDHEQLTGLATAGSGSTAEVADSLLNELERAEVLPDGMVPADAVRMGARVRYRASGTEREVELVLPADADIGQGRISVLTPVGAALIGLRRGQSITWTTRDGRQEVLTVVDVTPPPAGEDDSDNDPGPSAA